MFEVLLIIGGVEDGWVNFKGILVLCEYLSLVLCVDVSGLNKFDVVFVLDLIIVDGLFSVCNF